MDFCLQQMKMILSVRKDNLKAYSWFILYNIDQTVYFGILFFPLIIYLPILSSLESALIFYWFSY